MVAAWLDNRGSQSPGLIDRPNPSRPLRPLRLKSFTFTPEKSKELPAKNAKNIRKVRKGNQIYDIPPAGQTFWLPTCKICNAIS
jgi:hypothetical protein